MTVDERNRIGGQIVAARKRKGMSQRDLAAALVERFGGEVDSMRRSLVNNETGKYAPRMRTLEAIAEITEQPLDFFRANGPASREAA